MKSNKFLKKIIWLCSFFLVLQANSTFAATTTYVCTCKGVDISSFTGKLKEVPTCDVKPGVFSECESYCGGKDKIYSCLPKAIARPAQLGGAPLAPTEKIEENNNVQFTPQIGIPGSEFQQGVGVNIGEETKTKVTSDLLGRYVVSFYNWGLSIGGVLAVLMLMAGGLIWLTSAGDSGKIDDAKKMISGSLLGVLLLVGAYFFLNTINPDLTKMPILEIDTVKNIKQEVLACCDPEKGLIETPIKLEEGKKIALEGNLKGKEIKCKDSALECKSGEVCTHFGKEEKYTCKTNNVCCSCWWTTLGMSNSVCLDNITVEKCAEFCSERKDILRSDINLFTASTESHQCAFNWRGMTGSYCGFK